MAKTNTGTAAKHRNAWLQFQGNQFLEARRLYWQIYRKDRQDDGACSMLGIIEARLGNYAEADACLRRALAINPANFDAHLNLGLLLHTCGQAEPALASLHRALQISPEHPAALMVAGNVYAGLGPAVRGGSQLRGLAQGRSRKIPCVEGILPMCLPTKAGWERRSSITVRH